MSVLKNAFVLAPFLYWGGIFGLAIWLLWVIGTRR